jgi:tetratricopeptide (TPR) repeat protein
LEVAFLAADAIMMATPWQYFSQENGKALNLADKAQAILEQGMAQNPSHPGLTHLHIHLMENSASPELAEASADRLESLTPKAGHMVHMPGHIYMRVGRYADAIATNERSLLADKYMATAWGDLPFPSGTTYGLSHRGHAPHASNFIHWGAVLQGNSNLAIASIKSMVDRLDTERLQSGGAQRTLANYWMTLRFFHRWEELLALQEIANLPPYLQGMWHFVRGSAFAAKDEVEAAQSELDALIAITDKPESLNYRAAVNTAADLLSIAQHELMGTIAQAAQNYPAAIEHFKQAVSKQDQLRYMEPPDWLQSTRLSLGEAYLDAENYTDAEAVYLRDLELLQENGWALYGLLQSLQAQQQDEEILAVEERFGEAWQNADIDLGSL